MLKRISLQNFKCFREETHFPLAAINLLVGANGKGKSTLLQSLLLLQQSLDQNHHLPSLLCNGHWVQLGAFNSIRNSFASKDAQMAFRFIAEKNGIEIEFKCVIAAHSEDKLKGALIITADSPTEFPLHFSRIHYLAADRLGPQDFYPKKSLDDFVHVGSKGEHVADVLHMKWKQPINKRLCLGSDSHTLGQQTEKWLREIFGQGRMSLIGTEEESSILTFLLNNGDSIHRYKPVNVGFGYSHVLPIIVAGLIAEPGEILMVENPEAYLFPKAQSNLSHFLARVASGGVQVFMESHSEHVFNALRVGVKNNDFPLTNKDVSVLYFTESGDSPVVQIPINPDGSVENWPQDFFDQAEKDLKVLIEF